MIRKIHIASPIEAVQIVVAAGTIRRADKITVDTVFLAGIQKRLPIAADETAMIDFCTGFSQGAGLMPSR